MKIQGRPRSVTNLLLCYAEGFVGYFQLYKSEAEELAAYILKLEDEISALENALKGVNRI